MFRRGVGGGRASGVQPVLNNGYLLRFGGNCYATEESNSDKKGPEERCRPEVGLGGRISKTNSRKGGKEGDIGEKEGRGRRTLQMTAETATQLRNQIQEKRSPKNVADREWACETDLADGSGAGADVTDGMQRESVYVCVVERERVCVCVRERERVPCR